MRIQKVEKVRWTWPWPKKVKPVLQSKKTDNKKSEKENTKILKTCRGPKFEKCY